jgi:phenylalanyl-tRNA synthetase beta chain
VVTGPRDERHWLVDAEDGEPLDFFDLKGLVETLLARLHIEDAAYEPVAHPTFQEGRTARLSLAGEHVGILGEVHPDVRQAFDLPAQRIAAAELDLEALLAHVPDVWYVEPITPYPAVLQDLAVVVDEAVPAAAVRDAIAEAGGFLLRDVQLFDVYRGESIPAGKKSLAYALTFQAPDKTLRDEIAARQVERIVARLRGELGADLRS